MGGFVNNDIQELFLSIIERLLTLSTYIGSQGGKNVFLPIFFFFSFFFLLLSYERLAVLDIT